MSCGSDESRVTASRVSDPAKVAGSSATPAAVRLSDHVRSDHLPKLQALLALAPAFAPFLKQHIHLRLIIDANIVHDELSWKFRRSKPAARTSLEEASAAGIVTLFAPTALVCEIEEHLVEIATRHGKAVEAVRQEWHSIRSLIHFYEPKRLRLTRGAIVPDPDDVPYAAAMQELGADAVLSRDHAFDAMQVPVVTIDLSRNLRDYARALSIQLATETAEVVIFQASWNALKAIRQAAGRAFKAFQRLPMWLQIAIGAGAIIVLLHPKTREKVSAAWRSLKINIPPEAVEIIGSIAQQITAAYETRYELQQAIGKVLPAKSKRSALMCARAVCVQARRPLGIADIQILMKHDGYVTRAKDFGAYLRRVLRSSGQFVESNGLWTIRHSAQAAGSPA